MSHRGYADANRIRAICYDETVYPDPHKYDPARFLDKEGKIDPSVKAPETMVFGTGRRYECSHYVLISWINHPHNRVCPGRHLVLRILCFTVARVLAAFDILPQVDDGGRPKIPEAKFRKGLVR